MSGHKGSRGAIAALTAMAASSSATTPLTKDELIDMHAQLEDARGGPTWNGIGLRDVTINHQQAWQQNMQHNQQKMMEQQMQREQDAMQQRLLAREKQQVEVQRKRAAAKGGGAANVQSNLKVGYAAMQVDGTRG